MRIVVLVAGLFLVGVSATCAMAEGPYIGASGGVAFYHETDAFNSMDPFYLSRGNTRLSYDPGYSFRVAGGYSFDSSVRVEGEVGYKKADVSGPKVRTFAQNLNGIVQQGAYFDDSYLRVLSFMVNGYYDFRTKSSITPFVGAGIGVLHGNFGDYDGRASSDTAFGYQLSAGASYGITEAVAFDLSYRFEGAANDFSFDNTEISYRSSNVLAGLRYTFR
jgi:outer membrane immunogenic protein